MSLVFEWDFRKAKANLRKHKVSFDETCTVFDDPLALIFPDEDHSNGEEREIVIGHSLLERLLMVSFTERATGRIRIVSARATTRKERRDYEEIIGD